MAVATYHDRFGHYEGLQPEAFRAMLTANGGEKVRHDGSGRLFLSDGRRRDLAER